VYERQNQVFDICTSTCTVIINGKNIKKGLDTNIVLSNVKKEVCFSVWTDLNISNCLSK